MTAPMQDDAIRSYIRANLPTHTGWWASILGLLLIPIYGALMFGACFATGSITKGG